LAKEGLINCYYQYKYSRPYTAGFFASKVSKYSFAAQTYLYTNKLQYANFDGINRQEQLMPFTLTNQFFNNVLAVLRRSV